MIDSVKIEEFRTLGEKAGKVELEKYAKDLGVNLKKSMSFDNMVKALEDSFTAPMLQSSEIVDPVVPDVDLVDLIPSEDVPVDEVDEQPVGSSDHRFAFDIVGDKYPWAWNMSNINNRYWYSGVDSAQHAELMSDVDSEFKSFVDKLMKDSGMAVVVREPRYSQFLHITPEGITSSNVIYL